MGQLSVKKHCSLKIKEVLWKFFNSDFMLFKRKNRERNTLPKGQAWNPFLNTFWAGDNILLGIKPVSGAGTHMRSDLLSQEV